MTKITDSERASLLYEAATAALRKNTERRYQMSWHEAVLGGVMSYTEEHYASLASPAFVLRLLRRAGYR